MSIRELLGDFVTSIRGILVDRREAHAVKIAKLEFRGRLHIMSTLIDEDDNTKHSLLDMIEIELDTATKKEDIERLLQKLSKIIDIDYPE